MDVPEAARASRSASRGVRSHGEAASAPRSPRLREMNSAPRIRYCTSYTSTIACPAPRARELYGEPQPSAPEPDWVTPTDVLFAALACFCFQSDETEGREGHEEIREHRSPAVFFVSFVTFCSNDWGNEVC